MSTNRPLAGRVALVAGASRGAGRAIAITLAEQGAIVYATGRSARGAATPSGRPETIDDTAALARDAGGDATAVVVDHTDPAAVAALVARIERDAGRLDVLVNNVNGDDAVPHGRAIWETDLAGGLGALERGVFAPVITTRQALPLILRRGRGGLVVGINDLGVAHFYYGLTKRAVAAMAALLADELRPHGVACVALSPGFLRSEAMLDHFGVTEATWRDAIVKDEYFESSETPYYVARALAALAADPDVMRDSGAQLTSWGLAERYGIDDVDGRRPHWERFYEAKLAARRA